MNRSASSLPPPTLDRLPDELFEMIIFRLPLADLMRAVLVTKRWRTWLLGTPDLWTYISLSCWAWRRIESWAPLLAMLFARSKELPLTVELEFLHNIDENVDDLGLDLGPVPPPVAARRQFIDVFIGHARRIKSLLLSTSHNNFMAYFFKPMLCVPMPILESFRCVLGPPDFMGLPDAIFANSAPRLRDLSLSRVFLPHGSCPALQPVTDLYYDVRCVDDRDIEDITTGVPSLRTLTIIASENGEMHGTARCPMALDLRVLNQRGVDLILRCFENATSVCLTSVMAVGCDPHALTKLLMSATQVTSIDIDWQPVHVDLTDSESDPRFNSYHEGGAVVIQLNGKKVAVDLSDNEVTDAIRATCPGLLYDLRTLAVLEELWFVFSERELPVLDQVTLYLFSSEEDDSWEPDTLLKAAPATPSHKTTCLRLEALYGCYTVFETDIVELIRSTFDVHVLRKLVLSGTSLELEQDGPLRSLVPHLEISFERLPDRNYRVWTWPFSTEDALQLY